MNAVAVIVGDLVKQISLNNPLKYGFITVLPYTDHRGVIVVQALDPYDNSPTIFDVMNIVRNYGSLTFDEFKEQYPEEQI